MTIPAYPQEYHPELIPRRGEFIAWFCVFAVLAGWLVFYFTGNRAPFYITLLGIFLLLVAVAISLGNWIDRHTVLRLGPEGVYFTNVLRKVDLKWQQVQSLLVKSSSLGDKVYVLGESGRFSFRTLSEVRVKEEIKGYMGFADGDKIVQAIVSACEMKKIQQPDKSYYYARE